MTFGYVGLLFGEKLTMDNLWDKWSEESGVKCSYSEKMARVERLQKLEVSM